MVVRLVSSAGQTLGEVSSKDELLMLVQREAPPATVIEARDAETGDVVDLDGIAFEGIGVQNLVVDYIPARQQLERLRPDVCGYIDRLVDAAARVALALRVGRQIDDTEFLPVLDGLDWVSRAGALAAQLAAHVGGQGDGSVGLVGGSDGMGSSPLVFLEELQRALEDRDSLRIADILESELTSWLEEERSRWQSMGCESS